MLLRMSAMEAAQEIPHLLPHKPQLVVAAGRRGYGKTTFLNKWCFLSEPRVLALDAFGDFKCAREVRAAPMDENGRRPDVELALKHMQRFSACWRRLAPPISVGKGGGDDDSRDYGDYVFQALSVSVTAWDLLLLLDEILLWSSSRASRALSVVTMQGRRMGIRMAVGTQRIALAPDVILIEATSIVWFRTTRPRDLDVAEEWAGRDVREVLPTLKVGECVLTHL